MSVLTKRGSVAFPLLSDAHGTCSSSLRERDAIITRFSYSRRAECFCIHKHSKSSAAYFNIFPLLISTVTLRPLCSHCGGFRSRSSLDLSVMMKCCGPCENSLQLTSVDTLHLKHFTLSGLTENSEPKHTAQELL